jgi:hypothetical protein
LAFAARPGAFEDAMLKILVALILIATPNLARTEEVRLGDREPSLTGATGMRQ